MRTVTAVLVCVFLSAPAFAGNQRPAPNSRNDDSPITRVERAIRQVVERLNHLLPVQPLDDPSITWPKP